MKISITTYDNITISTELDNEATTNEVVTRLHTLLMHLGYQEECIIDAFKAEMNDMGYE